MKFYKIWKKHSPWRQLLGKMPWLFLGFLCFAIGILLTLYADLGMGPWDVFHKGASLHLPFTLGQMIQITGLALLVAAYFLGEKPGLGSFMNMYFIGLFVDIIDGLGIFWTPDHLLMQTIMLILGIQFIGWATFFYLKVKLGAGPRDSLMEGLVKITRKPVWMVRGIIESTALLVGFLLGGPVGIGTLVIAFSIGPSIQFAFKIGNYSSQAVKHQNLAELFSQLKQYHHAGHVGAVQQRRRDAASKKR